MVMMDILNYSAQAYLKTHTQIVRIHWRFGHTHNKMHTTQTNTARTETHMWTTSAARGAIQPGTPPTLTRLWGDYHRDYSVLSSACLPAGNPLWLTALCPIDPRFISKYFIVYACFFVSVQGCLLFNWDIRRASTLRLARHKVNEAWLIYVLIAKKVNGCQEEVFLCGIPSINNRTWWTVF